MVHPSTPTGAPEQCRCGRPLYGPLAESLLPRIRRAAEGPHGITFVGSAAGGPDVPPVRVSWKQLHREACAAAAALQARGVARGITWPSWAPPPGLLSRRCRPSGWLGAA